ncbi:MAG TPA: response regulator [Caulobacteraceae bacterium]|jgi:signal transduction histidine kinase/DNA-binding response OmpR family regulator
MTTPKHGRHEPDELEARPADVRFLIERNADGIIVVDAHGAVLFANPAAEVIFGRPSTELVGAPVGLPVVVGETTEISILRPRGDQIDAEMRVVETTWRDAPALLVSVRDISARKTAEERLRHAQKMESIGRLTAGIAHDFNNLLTVVMGNLAILQRNLPQPISDPKLRRASEHAMEGAQRAASLTQRLLAFARRQPLEPKPVDVNRLIQGMSDLLGRTLGERVEVQTRLCEGVLRTLADPSQLEAAILNLAVNARDAMPEGGRLLIETEGCRLGGERPELAPGDYAQIRVSDTGVGMTEQVAAQAIEPFFTTKGVGLGTGLGLSQVFGFVKQSGGDVKIESAPARGTTVTLYMRSLEAAEQDLEPPVQTTRPDSRGETILVVEDDEQVRRFGVDALRELGYNVLHAGDGATALRLLADNPDIVLLFSDLGLPGGMSGRELADEARNRRPDLRVLMTSAYAADALVRGGRLEPGVQLLSKPFSYGALGAKIRAVLDAPRPTPRVLVVEDDPMVRLTIVEALLEAGCQVDEAATASEAMAKFGEGGDRLDAVVVDVGLPDGRGDRLVEAFRTSRPDVIVLLATGYGDAAAKATFASHEGLGVLEKPFDGDALRAALRELGMALDQ